jgi:hypothetical protein
MYKRYESGNVRDVITRILYQEFSGVAVVVAVGDVGGGGGLTASSLRSSLLLPSNPKT